MHESMVEATEALTAGKLTRADFVRRGLAAGLSLPAIGSMLAACGSSASAPTSSKAASSHVSLRPAPTPTGAPPSVPTGTLVFGNAEPPTALYWDPAAGFGLADEQIASLVHDTLLSTDQHGNLRPSLATAYARVNDRTMRVELRSDVQFQDGTPMRPADVVASFNRLGSPNSDLAQAITVAPLKATVTGSHSLEIVTDKPYGPLDRSLGYVKILPESDINNPSNFKRRAMGTGPYKFVSATNNVVTLGVNPLYWGPKPHIKTIQFNYIEDQNARINALLTGQIHILSRAGMQQIKQVQGNSKFYTTNIYPPGYIGGWWQHNGPLGDQRVRQAVAYAIDRNAIVRDILGGLNPVGQSSLPTNDHFYRPLTPAFEFNPTKAKQLIAGMGTIKLTQASASLLSNQTELDAAIAQYLEQVGFKVTTTHLDTGAFRTGFPSYDLSLNTNNEFTDDPDFILSQFQGPVKSMHLDDPAIAPMVAAERETVGPSRATAVTRLAQYLWEQQDAPILCDDVWIYLVSSKVADYKRAPVVGEALAAQAWLTT